MSSLSWGDPLIARMITQRQLRSLVNLPVNQQERRIQVIFASNVMADKPIVKAVIRPHFPSWLGEWAASIQYQSIGPTGPAPKLIPALSDAPPAPPLLVSEESTMDCSAPLESRR